MNPSLSASAQKVQNSLVSFGVESQVVELPSSTRTAQDAASSIGCHVGQIAKSLVFRATQSSRCVLVIASGVNRVDEKKIGALLDEPVLKADAEFVRQKTGFAIGGIPPIAHLEPPVIFIDKDLYDYAEIWAAAGTPNSVFKLTPAVLEKITKGTVCIVKA